MLCSHVLGASLSSDVFLPQLLKIRIISILKSSFRFRKRVQRLASSCSVLQSTLLFVTIVFNSDSLPNSRHVCLTCVWFPKLAESYFSNLKNQPSCQEKSTCNLWDSKISVFQLLQKILKWIELHFEIFNVVWLHHLNL